MALRTLLAKVLLPIMVVVYWAAGWATGAYPLYWSFPFVDYENAVEKSPTGGFSFPRQGIAHTEAAPKWVDAAIKDNAFEVDLKVRPYSALPSSTWIFNLSLDDFNRNFSIGQHDGTDLVVRLRTPATGPEGTPGYRVQKFFGDLGPHRIVVRVEPGRMHFELDDRRRATVELPPDALSAWNPNYRLALGNGFTFNHAWRGEINQAIVRVRGAEFSYAPADLSTPEAYVIDTKPYLKKLLEAVSGSAILDALRPRNVIINVIGFMPLGLVLAFVVRKPASLAEVCAWCGLMSLSIEIGQIFVDGRNTSIGDLLLNTAGGGIGGWLGRHMQRFTIMRTAFNT